MVHGTEIRESGCGHWNHAARCIIAQWSLWILLYISGASYDYKYSFPVSGSRGQLPEKDSEMI